MEKKIVASIYGVESPSGLQLINGNRAVTDLKHVAQSYEKVTEEEDAVVFEDCKEYIRSAKELCEENGLDWSVCTLLSRSSLKQYTE